MSSILEDAQRIKDGKSEQHGDPEDSFQRIAHYWNTYLIIGGCVDPNIKPADVAEMMGLFKLARAQSGRYNVDDYRDMVGYFDHANRLRNE